MDRAAGRTSDHGMDSDPRNANPARMDIGLCNTKGGGMDIGGCKHSTRCVDSLEGRTNGPDMDGEGHKNRVRSMD